MKIILATLILSILGLSTYSQNGEKRIALVIGNSNYVGENTLKNPVNDANLMASTLTQLGFTVIKRTDVNRQQMTLAIASFWEKLGEYNIALFYFAGHGVAVNGTNYLLPIDAQMEDIASVELDAISVSSIVSKFDKYTNNTNILILDACRNNPFKNKRGGDRGFKAINPTKGTLIAFAASDGEFANDNPNGNNGLFTEKLVSQMKQPIMVEQVFKKTRTLVQMASNNEQNPMEWNMLNNDFYFTKTSNMVSNKVETSGPEILIEEETLTGTLKITSNLDGMFYLDGVSKGAFNTGKIYTLKNIPVGKHILKIGEWEKNIIITTNKITEISAGDEITTISNTNTNSGGYVSVFFDDFNTNLSNWKNPTGQGSWSTSGGKLTGNYDITCGSTTCPQADLILNDQYQISDNWKATTTFTRFFCYSYRGNAYGTFATFSLWTSSSNKIVISIGDWGVGFQGGNINSFYVIGQKWNGSWSGFPIPGVSDKGRFNYPGGIWNANNKNSATIQKNGTKYKIYFNDFFIAEFDGSFLNGTVKIGYHTYGAIEQESFQLSKLK